MGATTPTRLDYETPTTGSRFRRHVKVLVIVSVAVGIAGTLRFGPAAMQWWQAQRNTQTRLNWLNPRWHDVTTGEMSYSVSSPLIVHGRRNANGLRLVAVMVHKQALIATVAEYRGTGNWANSHKVPPDPSLRYYSPYIDPQDKSRFTIRYELRGEHGVIDGKLHDDERVRFTFRTGPLARGSSTLPSSED